MTERFFRFRRKRERGPLNEDWAVGDRAQCIDDDWQHATPADPKRGDVLRVSELFPGQTAGGLLVWGLRFVGRQRAYHAASFVKLRPCDEAFAEIMRRVRAREKEVEPA